MFPGSAWLALLLAPLAQAQEAEEDAGLGLNLDMEISSAYAFRGMNVFAAESQMDIHPLLAPSATWYIGDSGLNVGTWWAFQAAGDNRKANVEGAVGHEMDLWVGMDGLALGSSAFSLTPAVFAYTYPFAGMELYLEPQAALTWSGPLEVGLLAAWMTGVQDTEFAYGYLSPSLAHSMELSDASCLDAGASFGYKLYKGGNEGATNVMDVQADLAFTWAPSSLYVMPAVHAAWTDLGGDFADGLLVWGGVNVGYDL